MSREEILIELKRLPFTDKLSVLAVLTRMVDMEKKDNDCNNEIEFHVKKMSELAGDGFLKKNTPNNVRAKTVLSICLMEKGYSLNKIGKVIDRDHSTISAYKRIWFSALAYPNAYRELIELYNEYKKMI